MPNAPLLIPGGDIPGPVAVTPASAAAAKSAYAMTDLGNLGDGVRLGFRINAASSEVVGRSYLGKVLFLKCGRHTCRFTQIDPFSWTAGLGTLDSAQSAAYVINDNGQIVASGSNTQGQEHAFLLTRLVSAPRIYRPPA